MYYVHDLYEDTWESFESREAVIERHFMGNSRFRFDDLNVTGNDCYAEKVYDGYIMDDDGVTHPVFWQYGPVLRRYQVFDDEFRSVDVRLWPEADPKLWTKTVLSARSHYSSFWRFRSGSKQHQRSLTGPAMAHSTSRQNTDCVDYEELYDFGLPVPEKDRSAVRRKVLISDGDYAGYLDDGWHRQRGSNCSRSWKDQYKSRKQWGKHRNIPRISQEAPENGEDLVARLTAELILGENVSESEDCVRCSEI